MVEINLSNQVALVTGAGTGIGKGIALKLAKTGAKVAVNYNSSHEAAEAVVKMIREIGGEALLCQCDVTVAEQVEKMVAQIEEDLGAIDILVNNAGSLVKREPIETMSLDLWQTIVDVNQKSVFLCTKAVIPSMKQKNYGRIINISSIAARNGGGPGAVMYATTKAAVSAFTKGLAKELTAFGINVNGVAPGLIGTPFHDRFTSNESRKATTEAILLKREGTPEEVADAVLYLASPLSNYVVGEMIEVNGGLLMD